MDQEPEYERPKPMSVWDWKILAGKIKRIWPPEEEKEEECLDGEGAEECENTGSKEEEEEECLDGEGEEEVDADSRALPRPGRAPTPILVRCDRNPAASCRPLPAGVAGGVRPTQLLLSGQLRLNRLVYSVAKRKPHQSVEALILLINENPPNLLRVEFCC